MSNRSVPTQGVPTKPVEPAAGQDYVPAEPVRVAITYCSECGYADRTLALASALMREFGSRLSRIEIVPWHDGSFDVTVNGELVHSMYRDGGFPEDETIIAAVRDRLAAAM